MSSCEQRSTALRTALVNTLYCSDDRQQRLTLDVAMMPTILEVALGGDLRGLFSVL
ncbi:MAG: hypothetical protein ACI8PP_000813 [Candidatus Pseudothioglobus sp.]|jgi:hypothetical protein